ncbi:MAG: sulfatase-like hydrolase/transferase [candidate division Zixibacteria bacterium]
MKVSKLDRRSFLKTAFAGAGVSCLHPVRLLGSEKNSRKPNIVMIFVDDNVVEAINAGGLCPNIRSLGEKGITFTRAYTPHGVCGPTRFSLLTGRYMSRCREDSCTIPESRIHGSTDIGGLTIEGQRFIWSGHVVSEEWNVAKLLKLAGYKTFYAGKVHGHMQDAEIEKDLIAEAKGDPQKNQEVMRKKLACAGWDWAEALAPGNLSSASREKAGIKAGVHNPEWRAQATMDFIDKNKGKPFFCYIAENLMHMPPPWEDLKKDPRLACGGVMLDKVPDVMPSRESVFDRVRKAELDEKESAALLWLDDMVGAILKKLDDLKLRDNTMVVFMQDNGHRREGKNTIYEGGIHVSPTFISWPAGQKNAGRECSQLISNIDMVPTFMEAGGVKVPGDLVLDGKSVMPVVEGRNDEVIHESLYAEMGHTRAVVTNRWKYIAFRVPASREFTAEERELFADRVKRDKTGLVKKMGCRTTHMQNSTPGVVPPAWQSHRDHFFDKDQLYDLDNDPDEVTNLAYDQKYGAVLKDMKHKLRQYCLKLPGTFAEFKTIDECSPLLEEVIADAKNRPLKPVSRKRRISDKMPKVIGRYSKDQ